MKPMEAARLLGGYATGTLSEAERRTLFAAALDQQELFDALMDEEALRELLSDPAVKAQLIAALSRTAPPKAVPFWRRPGLLGAAAGLIVAATAGLAYLRSPEKAPPPLQEFAKSPQAVPAAPPATQARAKQKAPAAPPKETAQPFPMVEASAPPPPAPAPKPLAPTAIAGAPVLAREDAARMNVQAESRRAEAQDRMAKKAEAVRPPSPAAVMEVVGSVVPAPPAERAKAKASGGARLSTAVTGLIPTWTLAVQPDGSTRVTVVAPPGAQAVLLKRSASGVELTQLFMVDGPKDGATRWQGKVRLVQGDALDLYLLNAPMADPSKLPETGPVDGTRVRIHPPEKK